MNSFLVLSLIICPSWDIDGNELCYKDKVTHVRIDSITRFEPFDYCLYKSPKSTENKCKATRKGCDFHFKEGEHLRSDKQCPNI